MMGNGIRQEVKKGKNCMGRGRMYAWGHFKGYLATSTWDWQPQLPLLSLWLYVSHIHKNAGHFFSSHHLFGNHSAVSVLGRSPALYMVGRPSRWSPRYLLPVAPVFRFLIIYRKGDYPGEPNLLTGALYLFFNFYLLIYFWLCWIFAAMPAFL